VPTAREFATTDSGCALIEFTETPQLTMARPFAAGVPADRIKTLQTAFLAAHRDPQFLEESAKVGVYVSSDALDAGAPAGLERAAKDEEGACSDQGEADAIVPGDPLLKVDNGKDGENHQRNDLLDGLELGGGVDGAAVTVGRHRQAIFDKGQPPTDQDDRRKRHLFEAQVPVPSGGHENIGAEQ
jgi:hypothetical protein